MANRSDNPKQIKHLTLIWVRDDRAIGAPETPAPMDREPGETAQRAEPPVCKQGNSDLIERSAHGCVPPSKTCGFPDELPDEPADTDDDGDDADFDDDDFDLV